MKNQTKTISIFSAVFIGLITFLAAVIFSSLGGWGNSDNSEATPVPTTTPTLPEEVVSCQDTQGEELQNCCQQWAIENEIATVRCVGYWEIQDGGCAYVCGQPPTL